MAVAKVTEISASSPKGFEDAIQTGITRASRTLEHIRGAWLKDMKVVVENGRVSEYRVRMKITFVLKD
jgi:flavin-binding protein dodecin